LIDCDLKCTAIRQHHHHAATTIEQLSRLHMEESSTLTLTLTSNGSNTLHTGDTNDMQTHMHTQTYDNNNERLTPLYLHHGDNDDNDNNDNNDTIDSSNNNNIEMQHAADAIIEPVSSVLPSPAYDDDIPEESLLHQSSLNHGEYLDIPYRTIPSQMCQ
jgi:hypothetical protein